MTDQCAICGAGDVWKELTLPDAWVDHLAAEHGLADPDGYYLLPACRGCSEEVDTQKALDEALGELDDDSADLLARIDADELLEESGVDGE